MPEYMPIGERIDAQIKVLMESIAGIGTVNLWDDAPVDESGGVDREPLGNLDGFITLEEDRHQNSTDGVVGLNQYERILVCGVYLQPSEASGSTNVGVLRNRWTAKLKDKLHANPTLVEAVTAVRLVVFLTVEEETRAARQDGVVEAAVRVRAIYRTDTTDSTVLSDVIAAKAVA